MSGTQRTLNTKKIIYHNTLLIRTAQLYFRIAHSTYLNGIIYYLEFKCNHYNIKKNIYFYNVYNIIYIMNVLYCFLHTIKCLAFQNRFFNLFKI